MRQDTCHKSNELYEEMVGPCPARSLTRSQLLFLGVRRQGGRRGPPVWREMGSADRKVGSGEIGRWGGEGRN